MSFLNEKKRNSFFKVLDKIDLVLISIFIKTIRQEEHCEVQLRHAESSKKLSHSSNVAQT